jgi:hypothetical protein
MTVRAPADQTPGFVVLGSRELFSSDSQARGKRGGPLQRLALLMAGKHPEPVFSAASPSQEAFRPRPEVDVTIARPRASKSLKKQLPDRIGNPGSSH